VNSQFWWYVARASGLVAWALAALSILWGMALATRALGAKPKAPWLLDLHRFLGGLTLVFVGLHLGALVADSYVSFGWAELFVPGASSWRTGAVAWGVVAFWGLLAVELTSLWMKRLPRKLWHTIHLTSYLVFLGSTVHLVTAGTDAGNPLVVLAVVLSLAAPAFFAVYRRVGPGKAASVRAAKRTRPTGEAPAGRSGSRTPGPNRSSRIPESARARARERAPQVGAEVPSGERGVARGQRGGRALEHDAAAVVAGAGTEVDHPIGPGDDVEVVLDHDHRAATVDEPVEQADEVVDVGHVQA
jgi:DMSO/TMAO reductase YedYZ heme-binding membrane subunit